MNHHFRRWGVVYFLAGLAILFNIVHASMEWAVSTYDSEEEIPWQLEWWRSTMENLQSEVWQIFLACIAVDALSRTRFWFRVKEEQ